MPTNSASTPARVDRQPTLLHGGPLHTPDLIVLSHLRWDWVWQRPQHLVARFAGGRATDGGHSFYVEEPLVAAVEVPQLHTEEIQPGLTRVILLIPGEPDRSGRGFNLPGGEGYGDLVAEHLDQHRPGRERDVLVYTPLASRIARTLHPRRLAYDVMDDLASFVAAPEAMRLEQQRLIAEADAIFTGGRSLHRLVTAHRRDCHLYPSGVDASHYAPAISLRHPRSGRPVAGYVGVLDERIDLELVAALASQLPDWTLRLVGPVLKIDPSDLPQSANIEYLGQVSYGELPAVMAGFDVGLMPFALNQSTRSISPTKTLEYLAAGLPVVSTRIPDVVADYADVVHLGSDHTEFIQLCRDARDSTPADLERRLRRIRGRHEWDVIAAEMAELLAGEQTADKARLDRALA